MIPRPSTSRAAPIFAAVATVAILLRLAGAAGAAVVPTVALATSADYAVLGASTVTNTGNSVLDGSLGLWPGGSITGFPPGLVVPPGTTDAANGAAMQAQSDLTVAYVDAAGRPVGATTTPDLANLTLQAGVYAGPAKSPLSLTGPLVLDGAGDLTSVFIFQTDSTLITGSGSTVSLINGAQECNVFWQVGSSATLGTGSVFAGNILALTSITVDNGVTVHGRALARNGAVTLDNDTFTRPTCVQPSTGTTSTTTTPTGVTTVAEGGTPATTGTGAPGDGASTAAPGGGPSTAIALTQTGLTSDGPAFPAVPGAPGAPGGPGVPRVVGPPRTGVAPSTADGQPWAGALLLLVGGVAATVAVTRVGRPAGR